VAEHFARMLALNGALVAWYSSARCPFWSSGLLL
jgi:hypothetical protein